MPVVYIIYVLASIILLIINVIIIQLYNSPARYV